MDALAARKYEYKGINMNAVGEKIGIFKGWR